VAGLLYAVNAFHKVEDPILLSRDFKTRRLFHLQLFVLQEDAIQECSFNIKLVEFPAKRGSNVGDSTEGLQMGSQSHHLVEIKARDLGEAFGNISDFVSNYLSHVITFMLAD